MRPFCSAYVMNEQHITDDEKMILKCSQKDKNNFLLEFAGLDCSFFR